MSRQRAIVNPQGGAARAAEARAERQVAREFPAGEPAAEEPRAARPPAPPPTLSEYLTRIGNRRVLALVRGRLWPGASVALLALVREGDSQATGQPGWLQLGSGRGVSDLEVAEHAGAEWVARYPLEGEAP